MFAKKKKRRSRRSNNCFKIQHPRAVAGDSRLSKPGLLKCGRLETNSSFLSRCEGQPVTSAEKSENLGGTRRDRFVSFVLPALQPQTLTSSGGNRKPHPQTQSPAQSCPDLKEGAKSQAQSEQSSAEAGAHRGLQRMNSAAGSGAT